MVGAKPPPLYSQRRALIAAAKKIMHQESIAQLNVLAKLKNSHGRLREELSSLGDAAAALAANNDDRAALDLVRDAIDYFDRAVTRHEADEEKSLFPRLSHIDEVTATLAALHSEHATQRKLHDDLRSLVSFDYPPSAAEIKKLGEIASALAQSYETHLHREEHDLFPIAESVLDTAAHEAIASEMEARRGRGGGGGGGGRRA